MNLKNLFILSAVLMLGFSGGCGILSIEPDREVVFYDLGLVKGATQSDVTVDEFRNNSPYQMKLAFRKSPNSIVYDEYKRWSGDPADLTRSMFMSSFSGIKKSCNVQGEILVFECDMVDKTAVFVAKVEILQDARIVWHGTVSEATPIEGEITGTSFAVAMSKAVTAGAAKIAEQIKANVK